MEILPAQLGQKINCGNKFQFTFYYQPLMTKSNSSQVAKGKFLVSRVLITNLTDRTLEASCQIVRLHELSMESIKSINLHIATAITSDRWKSACLPIHSAGVMLDTFLVFDVPQADNWYFEIERSQKAPKVFLSCRDSGSELIL